MGHHPPKRGIGKRSREIPLFRYRFVVFPFSAAIFYFLCPRRVLRTSSAPAEDKNVVTDTLFFGPQQPPRTRDVFTDTLFVQHTNNWVWLPENWVSTSFFWTTRRTSFLTDTKEIIFDGYFTYVIINTARQ